MFDKVYVLLQVIRHEGTNLIGVYRSLQAANHDRFLYESEKHQEDIWYEVEEYDLV